MMTIGLIGTFIRDRIVMLDGSEVKSIGGLYHSLANAAFLAPDGMRLLPVARVGADFWLDIQAMISELPQVDGQRLIRDEQPNTLVTLIYKSPNRRDEISTQPMRPLSTDDVLPLRQADAVLVNMITGEDISREALQWLAENSAALLYFDLHTMALDRDEAGRRVFRKPPDWQEWLRLVDFVQMNQEEARLLADLDSEYNIAGFRQFMHEVLTTLDCRGMNITLGENGALAGLYMNGNDVEIRHIPVPNSIEPVDIIGCGDAFSAAFLIHYLQTADFFQAVEFGNRIASLNTTFKGSINREKFNQYVRPYAHLEA
ncbi:MAG: carbohydrate kinase family protein [candidate division KSB1 bacterium]|nr:carbohydrate kinase family protein [candidate division KSB1 bacterium]